MRIISKIVDESVVNHTLTPETDDDNRFVVALGLALPVLPQEKQRACHTAYIPRNQITLGKQPYRPPLEGGFFISHHLNFTPP